MGTTTALVVAKQTVVALLAANAAIVADGVPVSYGAPVLPTDLKASGGAFEAVWLGDAKASHETPILTAGRRYRDETIDLEVIVQVLKRGTAGTQEAADVRAQVIAGLVETVFANLIDAGVTSFDRFEVLVGGYDHKAGHLGAGQGHGSRFELDLEITARLTP